MRSSLAVGMASLDTAIANIALPAIAADLKVSPADVVWVVNVYQIALVATLLPLGALGEIVGHQRIYLGGLLLFTIASLGCACAWLAGKPVDRARAARPGRQRSHEREFGADPFRLSEPDARPRLWLQRDGGRHRLHVRADGCVRHSRLRALAVAVCGQYSLRSRRDGDRDADAAADAARRHMASIFSAQRWQRCASVLSFSASAARRTGLPLGAGRRPNSSSGSCSV